MSGQADGRTSKLGRTMVDGGGQARGRVDGQTMDFRR